MAVTHVATCHPVAAIRGRLLDRPGSLRADLDANPRGAREPSPRPPSLAFMPLIARTPVRPWHVTPTRTTLEI